MPTHIHYLHCSTGAQCLRPHSWVAPELPTWNSCQPQPIAPPKNRRIFLGQPQFSLLQTCKSSSCSVFPVPHLKFLSISLGGLRICIWVPTLWVTAALEREISQMFTLPPVNIWDFTAQCQSLLDFVPNKINKKYSEW